MPPDPTRLGLNMGLGYEHSPVRFSVNKEQLTGVRTSMHREVGCHQPCQWRSHLHGEIGVAAQLPGVHACIHGKSGYMYHQ